MSAAPAAEHEGEEDDAPIESGAPSAHGLPKLVHQRCMKLRANLSCTKYEAVREAVEAMGWEAIGADEEETDDWNIFWTDGAVSLERATKLRLLQRINHFPGMLELARKAGTARNLNRMLKRYPDEYNVFPATWLLPADLTDFKAQFTAKRNKTFIVKPSHGCQGRDITLTRSLEGINLHENYIAQRYMAKPYLLDGYKFDLRIYVLVTSVEPLRVYLHREGMVRLCTTKYGPVTGSNLDDACMHLTNYAINKYSDDYVAAASEADDSAHKRLLSTTFARLAALGEDVPRLTQLIREVCVKTLIAVQPHLAHTYFSAQQRRENPGSSCFEVLGLDVILDQKLKPFLLEVNHTPSFVVDTPLDAALKNAVLRDTLAMVSFSRDEARAVRKQRPGRLEAGMLDRLRAMRTAYEDERVGRTGYERLYPDGPTPPAGMAVPRYDEYLRAAAEMYAVTALSGSRRGTADNGGAGAAATPSRASASAEPSASLLEKPPAAAAATPPPPNLVRSRTMPPKALNAAQALPAASSGTPAPPAAMRAAVASVRLASPAVAAGARSPRASGSGTPRLAAAVSTLKPRVASATAARPRVAEPEPAALAAAVLARSTRLNAAGLGPSAEAALRRRVSAHNAGVRPSLDAVGGPSAERARVVSAATYDFSVGLSGAKGRA